MIILLFTHFSFFICRTANVWFRASIFVTLMLLLFFSSEIVSRIPIHIKWWIASGTRVFDSCKLEHIDENQKCFDACTCSLKVAKVSSGSSLFVAENTHKGIVFEYSFDEIKDDKEAWQHCMCMCTMYVCIARLMRMAQLWFNLMLDLQWQIEWRCLFVYCMYDKDCLSGKTIYLNAYIYIYQIYKEKFSWEPKSVGNQETREYPLAKFARHTSEKCSLEGMECNIHRAFCFLYFFHFFYPFHIVWFSSKTHVTHMTHGYCMPTLEKPTRLNQKYLYINFILTQRNPSSYIKCH